MLQESWRGVDVLEEIDSRGRRSRSTTYRCELLLKILFIDNEYHFEGR